MQTKNIKFKVSDVIGEVSGLLQLPNSATSLIAIAHGAGAGMTHPFMEMLAQELAKQNIGSFRYQFPYMEKGSKRPDSPKIAHPTVLAAIENALDLADDLPVLAGGKSFGGRMTSQVASQNDLSALKGLVFFGFPLHAAGRPGTERAAHLETVKLPMLFLQGTRDTLAQVDLIQSVCSPLPKASLQFLEGADHSFKMLKRSGVSQEEVISQLAMLTRSWISTLI